MKTKSISRKQFGNVIQEKAVTTNIKKGLFGRAKVKQYVTSKTTDYGNQKVDAKGTMTKTVYKKNGGMKTKTKTLSPRKIINKGY